MLSDVSIPINLWSDTEIVVTIPVGATSGRCGFHCTSMNDSNRSYRDHFAAFAEFLLDRDVGAYHNRAVRHIQMAHLPSRDSRRLLEHIRRIPLRLSPLAGMDRS